MTSSLPYYTLYVADGTTRRALETHDALAEPYRRARVIHARPNGDARKDNPWATSVEVWCHVSGKHAPFTGPDALVAFGRWGDDDVTCNCRGESDDDAQAYLNGNPA